MLDQAQEWSLESTPSGWILRVETPLGLQPPESQWIYFTTTYSVLFRIAGLGIVAFVAFASWAQNITGGSTWIALLAVALAVAATLAMIAPNSRKALDGTATQVAELDGETLTTQQGVFHASDLATLRAVDVYAPSNRAALEFTGHVVKDATFVGYPGLPRDQALQLIDTIHAWRPGGRGC